ncbi:MAG: hypothetical protein LAO09_07255 [Acidobacteriia bacterium]|nr:hypothetical protein [Terriglobia bacterium]
MKKVQTALLTVLPAVAVIVGLCLMGQPSIAQNSTSPNPNATQQQPTPPDDQRTAAEAATFTGKIVKSGGKLVLADGTNQTTYQLDDQQKAKEFVNKNVKVTGVLDISSGTIRVSAIELV